MKKNRKKHKVIPTTESHESMAALASGMADDFNNILTTVMGACSLIDQDDSANGDLHQCVSLIRASAEHAAVLSASLMRAGTLERKDSRYNVHQCDSVAATTSVRDKSNGDGIVSSNNQPGGVTS